MLITEPYQHAGLLRDLLEATTAFRFCLKARNTYAHCQRAPDSKAGLYFADIEAAANNGGPLEYDWKHTDASLLESQEGYCEYVLRRLSYLRD